MPKGVFAGESLFIHRREKKSLHKQNALKQWFIPMAPRSGAGGLSWVVSFCLLRCRGPASTNTTYQGQGMGIRNASKEYKDMSKNNKTET